MYKIFEAAFLNTPRVTYNPDIAGYHGDKYFPPNPNSLAIDFGSLSIEDAVAMAMTPPSSTL